MFLNLLYDEGEINKWWMSDVFITFFRKKGLASLHWASMIHMK